MNTFSLNLLAQETGSDIEDLKATESRPSEDSPNESNVTEPSPTEPSNQESKVLKVDGDNTSAGLPAGIKNKPPSKSKNQESFVQVYSPNIEWYEPEIKKSERKNLQIVKLTGSTDKGSKILMARTLLWFKTDKNGKRKPIKISVKKLQIQNQKPLIVEDNGSFEINMLLPEGDIQIPLRILKDKNKASYIVALKVQPRKIEMKDAPAFKTDCKYCFWIGAGASFLGYQQDPPQDIKEVSYGAIGSPAISVRATVRLHKDWRIRVGYHSLVGPDLKSSDFEIQNRKIAWKHMGLEADYRAIRPFRILGLKFDPALLIGVQNQDMPFLVQVNETDLTIESLKFNTASIGGMFFVNNHKSLYYEIYLRAQLPITSSGDVELESGFSFDGSLGAIYRLSESFRLGLFWGGQYHSYEYVINNQSGTYSLISSKLDLSLGYEF